MLGSDRPDINKKGSLVNNDNKKKEYYYLGNAKLVEIGVCNIHIVCDAFLKEISTYSSPI